MSLETSLLPMSSQIAPTMMMTVLALAGPVLVLGLDNGNCSVCPAPVAAFLYCALR